MSGVKAKRKWGENDDRKKSHKKRESSVGEGSVSRTISGMGTFRHTPKKRKKWRRELYGLVCERGAE